MAETDESKKPKKEIETAELLITNKQSLYKYFTNSFATLFFTPNRFVQQNMRIVGPVRLRTIHTLKKDKCSFDTKLNACYFQTMSDKNLFKEDIPSDDGLTTSKFQTCEENKIAYSITGENDAPFGC